MLTIENPDAECWRPVVGYEGWYEVSDLGRVRRMPKTVRSSYGSTNVLGLKLIQPMTKPKGYLYVTLSREGRPASVNVHRMVLEAFVGPAGAGEQACHFNGDRADNRLPNLRWDTGASNCADRIRHGTAPLGERHPRALLTEADVLEIRASRKPVRDLALRFGVSIYAIYDARSGRSWSHLPLESSC